LQKSPVHNLDEPEKTIMGNTANLATAKCQRGFSLLEVLIALLVLSIGLLGLAALQTTGLRSSQMASMRTSATTTVYDIIDRMRANPQGVIDSDYVIDSATTPSSPPDCRTGSCTTAQLAEFDLGEWKDAIAQLPGGTGAITQAAGTPPVNTIIVRWNELRDPAVTGTTCPPATSTDLKCFRLVFSE
jgi:type IV pilus assembly protein PilV